MFFKNKVNIKSEGRWCLNVIWEGRWFSLNVEIVVLVDLQSIRLVIVLNSGVGLYNVAPLPADVQVMYFSAFRHVLRSFPYLKHVGSVFERSAVLVCVQSHFQIQRHVTVREVEYLTRRSRSVF